MLKRRAFKPASAETAAQTPLLGAGKRRSVLRTLEAASHRAFVFEQGDFHVDAAAEPREVPIRADDAMARDDEAKGVVADGAPYGPR